MQFEIKTIKNYKVIYKFEERKGIIYRKCYAGY